MRVRKSDGCSWGVRTIRKGGTVRYGGRDWKLCERHMPYDGRLDGKRALVAAYERYEQLGGKPMLALHSCPPNAWPGDQCVDGVFVWDIFELVDTCLS